MPYPVSDESQADMHDGPFTVSVKRITEIEAVWRMNAGRETLLLEEPDVPKGTWKLAA